jgi:hypothetical protein
VQNQLKVYGVAALLLVVCAGRASAQKPSPAKRDSTSEQRAPKGMCRIWLKDVPPAQQPAPTDCATAVKNVPPNGRVIFGDADDKKTKTDVKSPPDSSKKTPVKKPPEASSLPLA